MNRLIAFLTRDPRDVIILREERDWLRAELKRKDDLLIQAYERAGVIPRQVEHLSPPPPETPSRKTMGEMQAEAQEKFADQYAAWQLSESVHLEKIRANNGNQ